jgi:aspartyl-tRNA(Asn)/glutamyl-tRNA(Gln) amidotransferase subunit A
VPFGATKAGLPVGVQICGAHFAEEKILGVAKAWEASK